MVRHQKLRVIVTGAALAVLVSTGYAQSPKEWRKTEKKPVATQEKPKKPYEGVTPGAGNNLPRVAELKNKPGTWVTWPGFITGAGGASQIFVQTTVSVNYEIIERKRTITIKLKDAEVFLSNNRNPLVTTHINTPLRRAYLKKKRGEVSLVMELKQKSTFEIRQTHDNDGYHYLFVDFPPGQYPRTKGATSRPSFTGYGTPGKENADETPEARGENQPANQTPVENPKP
jgi:hypothetical protein